MDHLMKVIVAAKIYRWIVKTMLYLCVGFETHYFSQRYGSRFGTYKAFIEPIMKTRTNLTMYKFSMAHKV